MAAITKQGRHLLLLSLALPGMLLLLSTMLASSATAKQHKPKQLDFFMLVIPQNLSNSNDPNARYNAVRSGAPPAVQPFTFGVLNTFDSPITRTPSLRNPADAIGRIQGWYGDCGQGYLALCLAQTFTYGDGVFNGTFSLIGVSNATAPYKEAAVVGGTGDFAYCRGVAGQHLVSDNSINNEENAWFQYSVTFKC